MVILLICFIDNHIVLYWGSEKKKDLWSGLYWGSQKRKGSLISSCFVKWVLYFGIIFSQDSIPFSSSLYSYVSCLFCNVYASSFYLEGKPNTFILRSFNLICLMLHRVGVALFPHSPALFCHRIDFPKKSCLGGWVFSWTEGWW